MYGGILRIYRTRYDMKKIYSYYNRIERMILGLILIALIIFGFISVVCRFVLKVPLAWAEELMSFCMVWVAYLGASAAANEHKHIRVSMFVNLLPKFLQKVVTLISNILWLICSFVLVYLGYFVTTGYIARNATSLGGGYPFWVASVAIPIGMILMSIRVILSAIDSLKGKSDERTTEEIIEEEMDT